MATSAPDQLTPRAREIVNAARELLEEAGIEALSIRRVAQQLGIRAPSDLQTPAHKETLQAAISTPTRTLHRQAIGQGNRLAIPVAGYRARGAALAWLPRCS
jgi:hypothetical protein